MLALGGDRFVSVWGARLDSVGLRRVDDRGVQIDRWKRVENGSVEVGAIVRG